MTLQERDLRHVWHPCSQMKDYEQLAPIVVDHARGVWLYDEHGKDYIDVISSWWCNLLGHCNPRINEAIKVQLDRLEHVIFANFTHEPAITLCEMLAEKLPAGLCKFNFSDNGSAAIECALKMSFQYHYQTGHPERKRFMALSDGYHGETIGALSVGGVDLYSEIYKPMLLDVLHIEAPDCYHCPYGCARESCAIPCACKAEQAFAEHGAQTAALIIEPMLQGAAGMRMYPAAYLRRLRELCDTYGVHLIADEIATGYGRTGRMFACDHAGISPDFICVSKGLTGGYMPMAITITTQQIYDAFYADYSAGRAFMHSHTYSGNPLACAAAIAVLKTLEEQNVLEQAAQTAVYLKERMRDALADRPYIGEVRSLGLVNAFELSADPAARRGFDSDRRTGYQVYKLALEEGLLLRPLGDTLYFNPPLVITPAECDEALSRCVRALDRYFAIPH